MTIHGGIGGGFPQSREISFDSIAAVQLCAQHTITHNAGKDYTTYELNLVLADPPGERISLASDTDFDRTRTQAHVIADIAGTEVLDHAMETDSKHEPK